MLQVVRHFFLIGVILVGWPLNIKASSLTDNTINTAKTNTAKTNTAKTDIAKTNADPSWQHLLLDTYLAGTYLDDSVRVLTNNYSIYYFPLKRLASTLSFKVDINQASNHIYGWVIDEKIPFEINSRSNLYTIDGIPWAFPNNTLILYENTIYISQLGLRSIIGIDSNVVPSSLKVNFTSQTPLPKQARLKSQQTHLQKIYSQVINADHNIDHNNHQVDSTPQLSNNSQDILGMAEQAEPDWDFLLLDAYLSLTYMDNSIEVITKDYITYYFPITELASILEFKLDLNTANNRISGWVSNQQAPFAIDLNADHYTVNSSTSPLPEQTLVTFEEHLYINQAGLAAIIGIDTQINTSSLKINFTSKYLFPKQAKLKRQQIRQQKFYTHQINQNIQAIHDNYHLMLLPNLNLSSGLRMDNLGKQSKIDHSFSIQGVGDVAWHAGKLFFQQNNHKQSMRFNLSRQLSINQRQWNYQLGDISRYGLGVAFNQGKKLEREFGHRHFDGYTKPGWEVELYRNNSLMAYVDADLDGYYSLDNIPVKIGRNEFRTVFYGPNGEYEEINESLTGHRLSQQSGQWTPSFSITENNKRLIPLDDQQKDNPLTRAGLTYGISDSLETHVEWRNEQDTRRLDTRLTGVWQSSVFNIEMHNDETQGQDWFAEFDTFLWDHDWGINLTHTHDGWGDIKNELMLNIRGSTPVFEQDQSYSLSLNYKKNNLRALITHYTYFDQLYLNNRLTYTKRLDREQLNNKTTLSFSSGGNRLRLEADYSLQPSVSLNSIAANYSIRFKDINLQLRAKKNVEYNRTEYSTNLYWTFEQFRLSTNLTFDQDHNTQLGMNLSMYLGATSKDIYITKRSLTNTATIQARTFLDSNGNGMFDPDERPISGIGFKGNYAWLKKVTDETGIVYLPQARTWINQYLEVKEDSIKEPFLSFDKVKYEIKTHSGGLNIVDIPLYETIEIQGILTYQDKQTPAANVPLILLDSSGQEITRINSEYDGFFLFSDIKPAQYQITIDSEVKTGKSYQFTETPIINAIDMEEDENIIDLGIQLIKTTTKTESKVASVE